MANKWYQKASVQVALVAGATALIMAIVAAFLNPWADSWIKRVSQGTTDAGPSSEPAKGEHTALPIAERNLQSTMNKSGARKLWITYAWQDNSQGDFDFLVERLREAGVNTTFDKVALVPGHRLWEQIAARIEDPSLSGWAILLTRESLKSQACREELAYALDRALRSKGRDFPLFGLIHGVPVDEIPAPLRTRLLVDLRNPQWPQLVAAGLLGVPPGASSAEATRYVWETVKDFRGNGTIAIIVRSRFGELRYWRFIYPADAKRIDWGPGPPQKSGFTGTLSMSTDEGRGTLTGDLSGEKIAWVGAGDVINPGGGCYIVFGDPIPKFVGFATSSQPSEPPSMDTFEYLSIR